MQFARPKLHSEEVISKIVTWLLVIVGVALAVAFVASALAGIKLLTIVPLALVLWLIDTCRIACNVYDNYGDRIDGSCQTRRAGDTTQCN